MIDDNMYSPYPTDWLKGSIIGSGSYGTVHLAIDNTTGALFVAKSARSESAVTSLKNEARILEKLNSRHIIKCIGKEYSENGYTLFFEYVPGGSLSDLSRKFGGTLDEKLIRLYTREILHGLKYLHDNGIVHADIKCKNVFLNPLGEIKLADFGCAQVVCSSGEKPCGGTPLWMAPEVLRNEHVDFAVDIWSLGCTVIEMATGRPPWGANAWDRNPMSVMVKIANGDGLPEFPRGFSNEGLDFLSKCLRREPRERWTSERLLDHPFMRPGKGSGHVVSPTSVLDVAISYNSDDDDDDGDDSDLCDDEFVSRVSLLEKLSFHEKKFLGKDLEGSDDWITVRSR
ncbi:mitogen-activated protein kinase kinase kinase 15 [Striga hermonthica]|uniref:Mitogen-activated protein kinase kinase kinase 15 n=1 Tax=Striga hermonthica TaxID=68872 RepID=A0A9N7N1M3_STRHE|nr:mitogen-activated protein kinase kinase kinase 15 [Striga hermonthica]